MVTVEADPVRVESRLAAGEIGCPCCGDGVLGGWGHARARRIVGVADPVRPRRARCRGCLVSHVLLPVTLLLRRAYSADVVWAALVAKAAGLGHRRAGGRLGIPVSTVRGWLRVFDARLHAVWAWFVSVAVAAGVDVTVPDAPGSPWRGALAAVEAATAAITARFGAAGVLGAVTAARVAVASSDGRLLAPGWPPQPKAVRSNTNRP